MPFSPHNYLRPPPLGFGLYYDPLYGYIPLPPFIRKALDLPSLQRLRHIKQLSTVYLVFPGATHSRFEHSVGVYYLADKLFESLHNKREHFFREDWPEFYPIHRIALGLASLFHDVGHGPWSHVFELFCGMKLDYRKLEHKIITKDWIETGFGGFTDIPPYIHELVASFKKRFKPNIPPADWGAFEELIDTELSPHNIAKIAVGEQPSDPKYTFLSNIVSGVFDVDRMDYLRRDALYTGIETGRVDIWEIIHSYTLFEENGRWIAGLSAQSATAVEDLLAIRDLTYRKVYYHPLHRCAQEMMIRAMLKIVENYGENELATMTDEELLSAFESDKGNAFTKDVANRIRLRAPYEALPLTINVSKDLDSQSQSKWGELTAKVPELNKAQDDVIKGWLQHESNAAKKLELAVEQTVIFDIRRVPITQKNEYEEILFIDEKCDKTCSLLKLLPHLGLTRGTTEFSLFIGEEKITTKKDLTTQYIQEISNILIYLPFDYLNKIVEDTITQSKRSLDEDITPLIKPSIEKMMVVIDEFIDFLDIQKNKQDILKRRFEESLINYLKEIIFEMRR